jgi:tripeptidyl-peptidase-1
MRLLAILALASAASALVPRWDDLAVKHAWAEVPRGWIEQGPAPPEHKMVCRRPVCLPALR